MLQFDEILAEDMTSLQKLEELRKKEERLLRNQQADIYQILRAVQNLRAGLQHYGTPQFARQARMAFMARAFLRSLTENGPAGQMNGNRPGFAQEDTDAFMQSISTVSTEFEKDFRAFSMDEISRAEFN